MKQSRSNAINSVQLERLMELSSGIPEIVIGLIDGPVAMDHPDLAETAWKTTGAEVGATCERVSSFACEHGTFVAGILAAKRGSVAPAICPGCTFLIRPIFTETTSGLNLMPGATPFNLARAVEDCVVAGARILNISAAIVRQAVSEEQALNEALDWASKRGVLVVSAAGNQSTVGSTAITRCPWVIPVAACDRRGRPLPQSNLGSSIGRRGFLAPGEGITSLKTDGGEMTSGGTSAATAFVTGTIALLWSLFPQTAAARIKQALLQRASGRRDSVVPPLLDAWASYLSLAKGSVS